MRQWLLRILGVRTSVAAEYLRYALTRKIRRVLDNHLRDTLTEPTRKQVAQEIADAVVRWLLPRSDNSGSRAAGD